MSYGDTNHPYLKSSFCAHLLEEQRCKDAKIREVVPSLITRTFHVCIQEPENRDVEFSFHSYLIDQIDVNLMRARKKDIGLLKLRFYSETTCDNLEHHGRIYRVFLN